MQTRSFGAKVILGITLASTVAVVLVCVVLGVLQFLRMRGLAVNQLVAHAQIMAIHSAVAMDFDDRAAAGETLKALNRVPGIATATLYTQDGREFISYVRPGEPAPYFAPVDAKQRFHRRWLVHAEPVERGGGRIGTLLLAYDLGPFYEQVAVETAIIVLIGALSIGASFWVATRMQRRLTAPVTALADAAQRVSETGDFSIRATKSSNDELGQLTVAFNNMLEQIQARDAGLVGARAQLTESNRELRLRNIEMEQFVYTASHELKTPLVTMLGFISLIRDNFDADGVDPAESRDAVRRVAAAAERMAQRIDDLLALSSVQRADHDPAPIDTGALVAQVVAALAPDAEERGIRIDIQPDMPRIVMNHSHLADVFRRLIRNALEYGCDSSGGHVEIGGAPEERGVRFFVRDYGPGIAPEFHDRVFQLFQRLHHDQRGSGAGLTIVQKTLRVHGGWVWVESTPGRGCTFHFVLPGAPAGTPSGSADQQPDDATWTTSPQTFCSSKTTTATP